MVLWCFIPNLAAFFLASLLYGLIPLQGIRAGGGGALRLNRLAYGCLVFVVLFQLLALGYSLIIVRSASPFLFLSVGLNLLFLRLLARDTWEGIGSFFIPLAFIFYLLSFWHETVLVFQGSFWVLIHVAFSFLTVILLAGAFLMGLSFWLNRWGLKKKVWPVLFFKLPPLLASERTSFLWVACGFLLLTFTLITGLVVLLRESSGGSWFWHMGLATAAWLLFGLFLYRNGRHFQPRRVLFLSGLGWVSLMALILWN